ncbi:MAG: cytochrome c peroxidase [Nannocystaceae bacterium]
MKTLVVLRRYCRVLASHALLTLPLVGCDAADPGALERREAGEAGEGDHDCDGHGHGHSKPGDDGHGDDHGHSKPGDDGHGHPDPGGDKPCPHHGDKPCPHDHGDKPGPQDGGDKPCPHHGDKPCPHDHGDKPGPQDGGDKPCPHHGDKPCPHHGDEPCPHDTTGTGGDTGDDTRGDTDGGTGDDTRGDTDGGTGDDTRGGTGDDTDGGTGGDTEGDTDGGDEYGGLLDLPATPYHYADPELPPHFKTAAVQGLDNTPADNPITDAGATLGRVLFYDTELSQNGSIACADCHRHALGFADGLAFSVGFAGDLTGRSSMSLANVRWYATGRFFWDERAKTLEEQVLGPIQSPIEMGLSLDLLVARISARPYADALFTDAFGDADVTSDRIARALAQFVRAMTSTGSRYDLGRAQVATITAPFPNFSALENQGKQLFLSPATGCAACHLAGPGNDAIFQPTKPLNNGLDAGPVEADNGVGDVTGLAQDNGRFKSPSLRNVALTAPYMHDGRFATLQEVIDHYDHGVKPHPNLDPILKGPNNQPKLLNLSAQQKDALIAFLGTLSDEAALEDPRFSDPFLP